MTLITIEQFKQFLPKSNYQNIAPALDAAAQEFGIHTNRQIRHWLAQISVESAYFTAVAENLNYSVQGLMKTWPHRFPSVKEAEPYAHNPKALGNHVYANRLGNSHPEDGYNFRGRGYIQLTGRVTYEQASRAIGLDLTANPDLVCNTLIASKTAAWYWQSHNLNKVLDQYKDEMPACKKVCQIINGGDTGLADREKMLVKASTIWKDY